MSTREDSSDEKLDPQRTSSQNHHEDKKVTHSSSKSRKKHAASHQRHDSHDESCQSDNQLDRQNRNKGNDMKPKRSDSTPELAKRSDLSQFNQIADDVISYPTGSDDDGDENGHSFGKEQKTLSRQGSKNNPDVPQRLLILSSKIKNCMLIQTAILPNVTFVHYKYETTSLENILGSVSQHLGNKKVETIAFLVHCSASCIYLSGKDEKSISADTITDNSPVREFFQKLVGNHIDRSRPCCRLDFLACAMVPSSDASTVSKHLQSWLHIPVGLSRDVTGSDIQLDKVIGNSSRQMYLGELYFKLDRLRWSGTNQQSLSGFEKIRTVGKGAYGTAVLYRKKDDDSLVILKEINLHDLTASERQMALNEVQVLAMLDHPNIISYYDSFEEDGIVMIEMEYADGGTLAQYLAKQKEPLSQDEILNLFIQIVSAIKYIHEHNILHRDLKTPNIFLTKEGRVKVGDFGISKLIATGKHSANTVLGTPYYISPEMCEGKPYNDKSDIWTLGCILYEMACLQRTFEGSNLPALVNKIMKGQFAPVKGDYSQEFKNLIMSMLQREPEFRPSAAELWYERLPKLMQHNDMTTDLDEDNLSSSGNSKVPQKKKTSASILAKRSVLYYFEMAQMQLTPIPLRSRVRIRNVAVSTNHMIAVTVEHMVYTWGQGDKGQLGHGDLESRSNPEMVMALQGKSVVRACCGEGFSVFASDNGIVMTCGDGTFGCLGHGDWCSTARPRLIEALLSVDVVSVACGPQHVVAVGSESEVFTWGCGEDGRLGLGNEENVCQPVEVAFQEPVCVCKCFCGKDGTMLLTDVGSVLACGNNQYNKLGLNHRVGFLMAMKNIFNKTEVSGVKTFCVVKALARHHVIDLHMGPNHSAVIVEPGHVYTFGHYADGQLGTGNLKQQGGPIPIKQLEDKTVFSVCCGEHYTVAGTSDNDLLFWGTRCKKATRIDDMPSARSVSNTDNVSASSSRSHSRQASTASITSISSSKDAPQESIGTKVNPETGENRSSSTASGPSASKLEHQTSVESTSSVTVDGRNSSQISLSSAGSCPLTTPQTRTNSCSKDETEIILQPTPLLRMDSSGSRSQAGDTVTLSQFVCHGENLFILVETTAPPPKKLSRKKRSHMHKQLNYNSGAMQSEGMPLDVNSGMSASSQDGGDEYSSEASELDAGSRVRALANRGATDAGNEPEDTTGEQSDDEASSVLDSSMSSIHINRNLKHDQKSKLQRHESHKQGTTPNKYALVAKQNSCQKSTSTESGIDVTHDILSSSSSSENMVFIHSGDARVKPNPVNKKTSGNNAPRKVNSVPGTVPSIAKSKSGPSQTQKPLSRLRAQGKTRRSDPKETARSHIAEYRHNQENLDKLQKELEELRAEKQEAESRLQKIETQYHKEKEALWLEAEKRALERERQLQLEILRLREDMKQQNAQLQDNFYVVRSLQEQLEKVQKEQACLSARPESRQSQRESRICSVQ